MHKDEPANDLHLLKSHFLSIFSRNHDSYASRRNESSADIES